MHPFIRACIHLIMHSFIHVCIHLIMHSFIYSCMHYFNYAFIHLFVHSFIHQAVNFDFTKNYLELIDHHIYICHRHAFTRRRQEGPGGHVQLCSRDVQWQQVGPVTSINYSNTVLI